MYEYSCRLKASQGRVLEKLRNIPGTLCTNNVQIEILSAFFCANSKEV